MTTLSPLNELCATWAHEILRQALGDNAPTLEMCIEAAAKTRSEECEVQNTEEAA